ncbi:metallophosphoesterase family protein [Hydrocarboniclastica marina]|uniref:metallophosphoesterase family protein n=1 Tax=Hydrocarboniclastica marina TaxID=2259620 RepID=UPI001562DA4A|nr:DNA repair exonuclease [Hydrocarboniclastica marina]
MPRFIHTADWQIGKQFGQFDHSEAGVLSDQRINTVARIGELATQVKADAILVAGDVFDMQTVSCKTLHRLATALDSYSGPWVLLPGNHDAAVAESVWQVWQRTVQLPANIHLALKPGVIELQAAGLAVFCAPLTQRHSQSDLTEPFSHYDCGAGLVRVGLAHGSVQGILPDQMETQNPIAADRALTSGLDYLALGDWHGRLEVNTHTFYSGSPETDVFRNNDSGNVLEVQIDSPGAVPEVTVHRTGYFRWYQALCGLRIREDLEQLQEQCAAFDRLAVVKLRLEGALDLATYQDLARWLGTLEARVHALLTDDEALAIAPSDNDLLDLQADGYLAEVVTELKAEQESNAVSREALRLLLQKLAQHQQDVRA